MVIRKENLKFDRGSKGFMGGNMITKKHAQISRIVDYA